MKAIINILVIIIFLISSRLTQAESPEEFFRGKTINWIIASDIGGGLDINARTIAPFLAKEIGVKVKVENRKTDEGINYLYNRGTRDGLTLGMKTSDALIGNDIMKAPGVQYESEKLNFVADLYPSTKMFQISPKLPYKTLDAIRKAKGLRAGGTSVKGTFAQGSAVMLEILGLNGKYISGFNGKKELTLALARGEIDFMVPSDAQAMMDEKDGYVINLFTIGDRRSIVVPNAPTLSELGIKIPKDLENVYRFTISGGQALALPPGVPSDRIEYLRNTFQRLSHNRDLRKAMEKLLGTSADFVPGQELQRDMINIKADKGLATKLDELFKKYTVVH